MKEYITFDLREIARELGAHFSQVPESEHFAWCNCGSRVPQDVDRCPGCNVWVVWKNSRTWKDKFGSPRAAIKRYNAVMPHDEAGQYLMKRAKQPGFKNHSEARRWEDVTNVLSQNELREIVDYCAGKTRARGLIKYVLNATEKKAESLPSATEEMDQEWEVIG